MATRLDKQLKRLVTVDGVDYTVVLEPEGFRLVGKGKRKAEVELAWRDLLSGDAAMAVALNASLAKGGSAAAMPAPGQSEDTGNGEPPKRRRGTRAPR